MRAEPAAIRRGAALFEVAVITGVVMPVRVPAAEARAPAGFGRVGGLLGYPGRHKEGWPAGA